MLNDLLAKFSTEADKTAYLSDLTAAHPYFAPAQFALLQRTPADSPAYSQQAAITALLFGNAHWLQFQLDKYAQAGSAALTDTITLPAEDEPVISTPKPLMADEVTETALSAADIVPEEQETNTIIVNDAVVNEITGIETPGQTIISATDSDVPPEGPAFAAAAPDFDATTTNVVPMQELAPVSTTADVPEPAETVDNNNDLPPMSISIRGPEAVTATELSFEPLFMTDYFASQGIKLSEGMKSDDKLGRQLKSFTDWLKSMKKTHPEATGDRDGAIADVMVQSMAVQSNRQDNVITESMAEVFALQGKRQKAIGIYQKLSLLNPGKSAYFAAKIENLKGN